MRVLIIQTAPLEELIPVLPVLDYLQKVFLGIEIDWLADESSSELLVDHPFICRLLVSREAAWRKRPFSLKNLREVSALKTVIQERRYDMVFDLEGSLLSGIVSHLSGCRRRYAFDGSLVAEPVNLRFNCNRVPLRRQDHHLTDRALRMVSIPFGKDYGGQQFSAEIPLRAEDEATAALFMATLSDGLVFLFHLGGADTRRWHEAGWIGLGKEVLRGASDVTILISWDRSCGYDAAERVAQGIGRQTRLLPILPLHGLSPLLKKVDLVVGGDCLPVQLAAALGTPTLSLYRSTSGKLRAPRGEMHRFIQSTRNCSDCRKLSCRDDAACRESITVEEMAAAARGILFPPEP
jgi:heptosyltransferase-1